MTHIDEWKQNGNGNWVLTLGDQSLSLPVDFELESSSQDSAEFIALGPHRRMCMIQYKRTPASELADYLAKNRSMNRCDRTEMLDLCVAEFQPGSAREKRKLGTRLFILELTPISALLVADADKSSRDDFVRSLVDQWAG